MAVPVPVHRFDELPVPAVTHDRTTDQGRAGGAGACASFFLDTAEGMSNDFQGFPGVIPEQALIKQDNEVSDTRYGPDFVFADRVGDYY
jgi:hypothetical protein